ncbi:unnamed protein product, partial [Didymodactylos carnosus]
MSYIKPKMLFIKQDFIPGPPLLKNVYINSDITNTIRSSYTFSNERFKSSDFLLFTSNHTFFSSLSIDYETTTINITDNSSIIIPSSSSSSVFIPTLIGIILFTITIWTIIG